MTRRLDGLNLSSICRKFRKPDFFITFTCNPRWVEISRELREHETVQDRPDLVSRVFKLKKDQLMRDIKAGQILGKVSAFLWVIEFQKRGLPHAHILVILSDDDRPTTNDEVDNIISAQLPPDPEQFPPNSLERVQAVYWYGDGCHGQLAPVLIEQGRVGQSRPRQSFGKFFLKLLRALACATDPNFTGRISPSVEHNCSTRL